VKLDYCFNVSKLFVIDIRSGWLTILATEKHVSKTEDVYSDINSRQTSLENTLQTVDNQCDTMLVSVLQRFASGKSTALIRKLETDGVPDAFD